MRKIFAFLMTSVDGFFEGPEHDLSWHNVDEEFNTFAIEQAKNVDLLLFGRRTYELMESFWPKAINDSSMSKEDRIIADFINNTPKIVFSKTLEKVEEKEHWKHVKLLRDIDLEIIHWLRHDEGKDIAVYGSSHLCVTLIKLGLIDEYRIMVNPVVLGKGTRLFQGLDEKLDLKLTHTRKFANGNVLLSYQPAGKVLV